MRHACNAAAPTLKTSALAAAACAALLVAGPAAARQRPITDTTPDAVDVAKTPVTDLNLDKKDIPPVLVAAIDEPYTLKGLKSCNQYASAVRELDDVLGDDVDLPAASRDGVNAGRVAKWAVSTFIPFRGLIREISGASAHDRAVLAAVRAGYARRSFLKGMGHAKGCKYPASPATPAIFQTRLNEIQAEKDKKADDDKKAAETGAADDRKAGAGQ
ncbi:hypothetical protein [Novosphingobium clariflavum]|uniref:Uncharacterized protein n=1 Tax=Novosphingobium clariflavum TaxID=2029884 RepID=A0ABV6S9P0_9SPHN|nr:hypothetical protein [Novosphingobium clariflavum]